MTENQKWALQDYHNAGIILGLIVGALASFDRWMAIRESLFPPGLGLLAWCLLLGLAPLGAALYLPKPPMLFGNQGADQ